ncbi:tRNA(NNU) t(6)A37 threonylcarbamoyladenosine modification; glycation binding protein [[Clostridium] ultunense Esp]|uniref:tRNA (adenosine(37)-N6)-threonylcarbamoyltransferase complex transferase subunit TsaD n=1 Tax=Thermicanus aegyptius TaxID=94009 RepID=UPI0002B6F4BD|nr:tRNA (adenosine(37)-N6)-threonylcarbamoyltransferase complex transferase subunit TsaD [Thermicanus aegyptius]CCQ96349.1 tRNA(NNU) t(6)A37 threonylcarbamoyladenosine modification; glycation binding protein [[Clostridium] ultunense Esp]
MSQGIILGIETSCDETSVAIVRNGREILSNVISSQIELHKPFGGVVPEIASRRHVETILPILEEALSLAEVKKGEIDGIAVTAGPGLVGALLVGLSTAKALSFALGKPLLAVNHIAGHIYANRFVKEFRFPLIALVVSGGHTELVAMEEHGRFQVLGETRDDAAGEAYDKVARALGLPYPGGPEIDRLAQEGKDLYAFPRPFLEEDSFDFSFSGLKSAVLNRIHQGEKNRDALRPADVAASFQAAVVEVLVEKSIKAVEKFRARQLLLAGGVAANRSLRKALTKRAGEAGVELLIPPLSLCTDNAAMIAAFGQVLYERGEFSDLSLNAYPQLSLA